MKKKEEDYEKLEEEVVMLRVKFLKLGKKIEEASTSSIRKVEEKCHRLLENKYGENPKSYAEVLKGRNHGQKESKKNEYNMYTYSTRPTTSRKKRSINHNEGNYKRKIHDQPKQEFRKTTSLRRSSAPRYKNLFYGYCFYCTNLGNKVVDHRAHGINAQAKKSYVAPHDIECYKFHNYSHIARNCRSMIVPSMKKEKDIGYTMVWKRKEKKKEHMNKEQVSEIARHIVVREEQVKEEQMQEIARLAIVQERQGKKYHNEEHVKE